MISTSVTHSVAYWSFFGSNNLTHCFTGATKQPQGWYHRKAFSALASVPRCWLKVQSLNSHCELISSFFFSRVVHIYIYIYYRIISILCNGIFFWYLYLVGRWYWSFFIREGDAGIMPFVGLGRSGTDPPHPLDFPCVRWRNLPKDAPKKCEKGEIEDDDQ